MQNKTILKLFIISVILLFDLTTVKAELDTTKNKEFILTFLPNFHNNWSFGSFNEKRADSIFIFIYASVPTNGIIEFKDIYGTAYTENFSIPDPTIVYIFKKPSFDYELRGYNFSGILTDFSHCEQIVDYSFKVTANNPVQVYGHNQAVKSSESFNVLPLESLGNEYLVLAYNSNTNVKSENTDGRTPSQFAVVATEDSTVVTLTPSVVTRYNGLNTQNITMNSGQVYMVQSAIEGFNPDLTKTLIKSNKPVAVFSGQQRARVPHDAVGNQSTRDYLAEQMPPIDSWSNDAVVVPFPEPSKLEPSTLYYDKLRIIAAYDDTKIYVDNVLITTLNQADVYEEDLRFPKHFKASAPIMAAGYKRSSGITLQNQAYRGDPLLQIIPTPGQYGESYRFITIQSYEAFKKVYDEHYMTVISEPDNIQTIMLDGNLLDISLFKDVEGSSYKYANIKIAEGNHEIKGDKVFGLFICGYGNANSYGYFCGIVSKRDDYEPPVLQSSVTCFETIGNVTDKSLKNISAPANYLINTSVSLETFAPYVTEAKFSAKLINNYLDGNCRIVAVDSIGQKSSHDIIIPGFTVALESEFLNEDDTNVKLLYDSIGLKEKKCYNFKLKNYGKFKQRISLVKFLKNHPQLTSSLTSDFELLPGADLDFEICFQSDSSIWLIDSLLIGNECGQRKILSFDLNASKDENEPQIAAFKDPCSRYLDFLISDSLKSDTGIDTVIVQEIINMKLDFKKNSIKNIEIRADVINPYKDSYIKILVRDRQGNETEFERKLAGFTIEFSFIEKNEDSSAFKFDFGRKMIGMRYCDSISLKNFGENEIFFNNLHLSENIIFSIPPSQLPFILKAGEEKHLRVCFLGNKSSSERLTDTLNLEFNCINEFIVLTAQPDSMKFDSETKCDIPLVFEVAEVPEGAFVSEAYPNPSGGIINIDFNNPENSNISIVIYNQLGDEVKSVIYNNLYKGYYTIPVDVGNLSNGYYFIHVCVGNNKFIRSMFLM